MDYLTLCTLLASRNPSWCMFSFTIYITADLHSLRFSLLNLLLIVMQPPLADDLFPFNPSDGYSSVVPLPLELLLLSGLHILNYYIVGSLTPYQKASFRRSLSQSCYERIRRISIAAVPNTTRMSLLKNILSLIEAARQY